MTTCKKFAIHERKKDRGRKNGKIDGILHERKNL